MVEPPGNSQHLRYPVKQRFVQAVFASNLTGNFNVALGGECWQKIEFLEDEANLLFAHLRASRVRHLGEIRAVNGDSSGGRSRESTQNIEQRGFAAAGRANNAHELTLHHGKAHATQGRHIDFADAIDLGDIFSLDEWGHLVRYYQTAEGGEVAKQRQSATFTFHLTGHRHPARSNGVHALRPTLLYQHNSDPFQQLNRSVHALGQKDVRAHVFVIYPDLSGEKNRGRIR